MKETKTRLPYNLQFFAEPSADPGNEPQAEPAQEPQVAQGTEPGTEPQLSAEEQLQQMRVEMAKLKKAQEKAASEAADYKKKYNATLSEAEKKAQEEAQKQVEKDEKFETLLKENTVTKLEKSFLKLGYPEDLATKAATAQYENDTDALFKIQSDFQASLIKNAEAEWLKSRPAAQTGTGEDAETDVTKEQFNKMGYMQRLEFKQKYPETYKKYSEQK